MHILQRIRHPSISLRYPFDILFPQGFADIVLAIERIVVCVFEASGNSEPDYKLGE